MGETERSRTCDELAAQFAAGRITDAELDERLEAAVSARTRGDLDRLVADLPMSAQQEAGLVTAPGTRSARTPSSRVPFSAFTVLDVVAALTAVGCGLAIVLVMTVLVLSGRLALFEMAVLGGGAAALLGASITHLAHRATTGKRD